MYLEHAQKLLANGYFPLPAVGKAVYVKGWSTITEPILTDQPGKNISTRGGAGLVPLDYDIEDDAALILGELFPSTPVWKRGQRGRTDFYQADFEVPSEDVYDKDGRMVMQILGTGKQTVIPPSIHPDTKQPYVWGNGKSLYNTPRHELPMLPRDYRERIIAAGFTIGKARTAEAVDPETGEILESPPISPDDSPHAEINAIALKNLDKWVPDLKLYNCKRTFRYCWEAVASWRPSNEGRELDQRDRNLKISSKGIRDFGVDQGYSALDLVMAGRSCSLQEALCWLEEKLLPPKPDIEIDLDAIKENQDKAEKRKNEEARPHLQVIEGGAANAPKKKWRWLGHISRDGDPIKRPQRMLIPYLLPDLPVWGYCVGQRSTSKTFFLNTLAVAGSHGGVTFAN